MTDQGFTETIINLTDHSWRSLSKKIIQLVLSLAKTEVPDSHNLEKHWCLEHVRTQFCQLLITRQKVESSQSWQNLAIIHFLTAFLSDTVRNTKIIKIRGIQQGTRMWNLALDKQSASWRDFRRKLNQCLDPKLTFSNMGHFSHIYVI